ncbi:MAG: CopG family ribbon-helix-helix protein [Bacteroidia bacterium]
MATEAFTIRAESDIVQQLDNLAGVGQLEKIIQGIIAAADRGELIAHDDVMQEMDALITCKSETDFKQ